MRRRFLTGRPLDLPSYSVLTMADVLACVECGPDGTQGGAIPALASQTPAVTTAVAHNPLDPATFVPPSPSVAPSITIEFCDRVSTNFNSQF